MISIPRKKVKKLIIVKILEFFNPEYLNIWIWLSLNKFIKKSCVDIRNIKGNISNIRAGELRSERYNGNRKFTLVFRKNSISLNIFKITTRLSITKNTNMNDFKKVFNINL